MNVCNILKDFNDKQNKIKILHRHSKDVTFYEIGLISVSVNH
jgi:hypothetical protein